MWGTRDCSVKYSKQWLPLKNVPVVDLCGNLQLKILQHFYTSVGVRLLVPSLHSMVQSVKFYITTVSFIDVVVGRRKCRGGPDLVCGFSSLLQRSTGVYSNWKWELLSFCPFITKNVDIIFHWGFLYIEGFYILLMSIVYFLQAAQTGYWEVKISIYDIAGLAALLQAPDTELLPTEQQAWNPIENLRIRLQAKQFWHSNQMKEVSVQL